MMADPAAASRESRRVLREGGPLAFTVFATADRNPWSAVPAMSSPTASKTQLPHPSSRPSTATSTERAPCGRSPMAWSASNSPNDSHPTPTSTPHGRPASAVSRTNREEGLLAGCCNSGLVLAFVAEIERNGGMRGTPDPQLAMLTTSSTEDLIPTVGLRPQQPKTVGRRVGSSVDDREGGRTGWTWDWSENA